MSIYDISVKNIKQEDVLLKKYEDKVLLIVNTATGCGFTPQYEGLQKLYLKYKDKGFEVLDFPCNQFLNQAPGTDQEIKDFCTLKYNTTFETFSKIKVNGKDAHPLFVFLKEEISDDNTNKLNCSRSDKICKICFFKRIFKSNKIKWNFTKFLVDKKGHVLARYAPSVKPLEIEEDIKLLLK